MGAFRVIEFDMENEYYGKYKFRMPVIPTEYKEDIATTYCEFGHETMEEIMADLEYYGFGQKFIALFDDLRYNNEPVGNPPDYKPSSLLHMYAYPNIEAVYCPDAETNLCNTTKAYDRTLALPIMAWRDANTTDFCTYWGYSGAGTEDSYGLRHSINLRWSSEYSYGFTISIHGIFADQLNGNKFDFSQDDSSPEIYISVGRTLEHYYYCQVIIYNTGWDFGAFAIQALNGNETDDAEQSSDDPYDDGGDSDGGGGDGSYDDDSDDVDFPDLPEISATDTGFVSLYVPSATQVKDLANYMWNNNLFDIATFKKLFADPMDAVIGMSIVPINVPTSGAVSVNVGNIPTGISMNKASAQFLQLDCGTINVQEYFGSYLDYAPYTSIQIYLPFIGYRDLKIDECMGPKPGLAVHLKYYIDILSGSCVAFVKCGRSMMYQFQGQCSVEIPFTGVEYGNMVKSAIEATTAIANISAGEGNINNEIGAIANAVMTCKPQVERSGKIASSGGIMAGKHPYLIITRPRQCKPENQNKYLGYPSFITRNLGGISGFTRMEETRLNNISCTDEEMEEIRTLLKEGVIL